MSPASLLGSILAGLRAGGGQVQAGSGAPVMTLKMPLTARLFVGLMLAMMTPVTAVRVLRFQATRIRELAQ